MTTVEQPGGGEYAEGNYPADNNGVNQGDNYSADNKGVNQGGNYSADNNGVNQGPDGQPLQKNEYVDTDGQVKKRKGGKLAAFLAICWCCTWPCHGPCCGGL